MTLNYKNRISLRLITASALIVLMAFLLIYLVVHWTILKSVDESLSNETKEHQGQISIVDQAVRFIHKGEWEEREHQQVQFNPIFIEIVNAQGVSLDKSPNLGKNHLIFRPDFSNPNQGYNVRFDEIDVRQMQIGLKRKEETVGYLLVATSFENESRLLRNLQKILFLLFPFILLSLFLILRFLAGKSIQPILDITEKAKNISRQNLNQRIPQPKHQDEIMELSVAINKLLERLENAMEREQQFTSDASHELRTPLAVLKGNFEVLVRKPRSPEEYVSKIHTGLDKINEMIDILDQLLILARLEKEKITLHEVDLTYLIQDSVRHIQEVQANREILIENQLGKPIYVLSNEKALSIIFHNLFENALKYSPKEFPVRVRLKESPNGIEVDICDDGIGIDAAQVAMVFNPFFRGDSTRLGRIQGVGLGLSIVKKLCNDLKLETRIKSQKGNGTTFTLLFSKPLLQS
ncbi:sensor histidine kinase [Lunatimonas salinarum]|uniref:sensor histidine kinase n=1 Tax=Lunatimonas salinarum TaxID=1774590 RepID=UPI001ADF7297|nr:HAMP domain-containing sensor histidine kinase [Lunatimonas salinarum]